MGDIGAIQSQRYWADEFVAETRFSNVRKSIHVQAALGIADPVEETKWLQAFADRLGHPHGIVAEVHLQQDDAQAVIERHMAYPNVRGVRDFGPGDYLVDERWRRGYAHLEEHDLVACLDSSPETHGKIRDLAEAFPNIVISLDHAGFPRKRDPEYFAMWKRGLDEPRRCPERRGQDLRARHVRPPLDGRFLPSLGHDLHRDVRRRAQLLRHQLAGGPVVLELPGRARTPTPEIISGFSRSEQEALFFANAERIFRI